jgi:hypothetical protein
MTDQEIYNDAFKKLLTDHSFLVTKSEPYIGFTEYINYFQDRGEKNFLYMVPPGIYEPAILGEFKDNLVFTTFVSASGGGKQMYSLFQLNEDTHITGNYFFIRKAERLLVGFDIYCRDGQFFLDFLDKYKNLEYKETAEKFPFGFGGFKP